MSRKMLGKGKKDKKNSTTIIIIAIIYRMFTVH